MYKLVIADDEPDIRTGLSECYPWHSLGFTVTGCFANGAAALDFITVRGAHALLTDIRMPLMDGLAVAKHLAGTLGCPAMVLLSGYADFDYARQAIQYGVKDYIVKPADYDTVIETFTRIRHALDKINPEEEPEKGYYDKVAQTVIEYIRREYTSATLEQAAQTVFLSPSYLSKLFKQHTGQSFSDYLYSVKMKEAARLLGDITLKTYDVAYLVGYDNPKNFSRAFKQYYGVPPRDYRENGAPPVR